MLSNSGDYHAVDDEHHSNKQNQENNRIEVELNNVRSKLCREEHFEDEPGTVTAEDAAVMNQSFLIQENETKRQQQENERSKDRNTHTSNNTSHRHNHPTLYTRQVTTESDKSSDTEDEEFQLPLEIQLALLEQNVFGWTHLTSTFFGHTLWPIFCFWSTHGVCRWLLLRFVKGGGGDSKNSAGNTIDEATLWWIEFVARACGLVAAYFAFRFIRQRRRVWLRSAYGSRAYQQDRAHRRQSVQQADRSNTFGKLMTKIQKRSRRRKLQKAKTRFAKKHLSRVTGSNIESQKSPSRRALFPRSTPRSPAGTSTVASTATTTYSSIAPSASRDEDEYANGTLSEASSFASSENLVSYSDDDTAPPTPTGRAHRRASLSTSQQPTSITQDHVAIPLIKKVAYAHGGFFGAAPFVLASPQWVRILRKLLPDVYVEISRRVLFSPAPKLIHWAENNPVVAAYGVVQFIKQRDYEHEWQQRIREQTQPPPDESLSPTPSEDEKKMPAQDPLRPIDDTDSSEDDDHTFPTIEWDIFLDPRLVRRVEAVLNARDKYLRDNPGSSPQKHHMSPPPKETYHRHSIFGDNEEQDTLLLNSPSIDSKKTEKVLEYLDTELKKRAQELTDQLLIAHGNTTQLVLEQTGYLKDWNYSRVQRTRQSLGGGMYARQWMAVFAEALRLATKYDAGDEFSGSPHNYFTTSMEDMAWLLNDDDGRGDDHNESFSTYLDYSLDTTMEDSVQLIQRIAQTRQPMSLVLDLKSRHVPKRVLGVVVDTLNNSGIHVEGIASFQFSEIRGVTQFVRNNQDDNDDMNFKKKTKEMLFVHSAGDLRHACEDGLVLPGDHVFFNGGSLIIESARQAALGSLFRMLVTLGFDGFDPRSIQGGYRLHSCAIPSDHLARETGEGTTRTTQTSSTSPMTNSMLSLYDYKRNYQFSMGVYVQEFSIDEAAARLLVEHVNDHLEVYDLGFAWGGVNGMTVTGIKPGRFTSTDGLWNQRHLARLWT